MLLLDFLIMFVIAAITGSIARSVVGLDKRGCIVSAIVGFVGALIGTWLGREFDLPEIWSPVIHEIKYPVVWSFLGAVIFTLVLSLISPKKKN